MRVNYLLVDAKTFLFVQTLYSNVPGGWQIRVSSQISRAPYLVRLPLQHHSQHFRNCVFHIPFWMPFPCRLVNEFAGARVFYALVVDHFTPELLALFAVGELMPDFCPDWVSRQLILSWSSHCCLVDVVNKFLDRRSALFCIAQALQSIRIVAIPAYAG